MSVKKVITLSFLLFKYCYAYTQIPEPATLFMEPRHGEGNDQIYSRIHKTPDGGFITTISTASQVGMFSNFCTGAKYKIVFSKYKSNGYEIDWEKCYEETPPDSAYTYIFQITPDNYVLGGGTGLSGPTSRDILIRKDDNVGNILWGSKRYGGSASEIVRDMVATDDGGFIAAIETNSNDGDVGSHYGSQFTMDIWVLKIDSNGNKVWSIVLGGSADEYPASIVPIPGGGCYVLGYTTSNDFDCITNHGNSDVFIARLDSNGGKVWTKCLGGSGYDGSRIKATSVWGTPDGKGGALLAAATSSADGDVTTLIGKADFWLANIDSTGIILWDKCYGGPDSDEFPQTICKSTDGSIWIAGVSTKKGGQIANHYGKDDAWLVHSDSAGNFLSAKVFGSNDIDELTMLHPLKDGLVMVGGTYRAAGGTVPDTFAGGIIDVFLTRVAPWTTNIKQSQGINDKLIAYPNPANTIVYISTNSIRNIRNISIYDISGKRVYKSNSMPDSIDVSDWPRGIYEVNLKTNNNIYSTKIVIQ